MLESIILTQIYINKQFLQCGNDTDFKPRPKTALVAHYAENGHKFNFDNVKILQRGLISTKKRKFVESLHIARNKNTVNFRTDVERIGRGDIVYDCSCRYQVLLCFKHN